MTSAFLPSFRRQEVKWLVKLSSVLPEALIGGQATVAFMLVLARLRNRWLPQRNNSLQWGSESLAAFCQGLSGTG